MPRFDVLTATDCRLPGGTAASTAEELEAQRRGGLTSALLHLESPLVSRTRPLNPRLRAAIGRGDVQLVFPDENLSARVLLLRHPKVALELAQVPTGHVEVEHCLVLVNQVPVVDGRVVYRADEVNAVVEAAVGVRPMWSPIGPLVREEFSVAEPEQPLTTYDWVNIIDVDAWSIGRTPPDPQRIRIGRHSRDHWLKWPGSKADVLAAYPEANDLVVRVLGGVPQALTVLGGRAPHNWELHPFGSKDPRRFLAEVDVYVYLHHAELTEAFGRNLLEAMASGAPVITDPKFSPLFGDAVWYSDPAGVPDLVRSLGRDPDLYLERSRAGQAFARERFGHEQHVLRLDRLDDAGAAPVVLSPTLAPAPHPARDPEAPTVLFVSPNGAGMGHLARLMAVAARLDARWSAHFLTFSTAASIVEREGFPVDYVASRPVTGSTSAGWHAALAVRLRDLIDETSARVVVIDGTEPYRGLLRALIDRPDIAVVWSRRGMWRPGVSNPVLETAEDFFDLIVEPGDAAAELDVGATSQSRASVQLAPVTFVAPDDVLDREAARRALGLPIDAKVALVALGAGNINDTDGVLQAVVDVAARQPDLLVASTTSPIALRRAGATGAVQISVFPLARYLAAFDVAVAAAGYNSFHELLAARVPTLFVPNESTITDDQQRRAEWAAASGVALRASESDAESVARGFAALLQPETQTRLASSLEQVRWNDGGREFVAALEDLLARPRPAAATIAEQRRVTFERLERAVLERSSSSSASPLRTGPREQVKGVVRRVITRSRRTLGVERSARLLGRLPVRVQRRVERLMTGGTAPARLKGRSLTVPTGTWIPQQQRERLSTVMIDVDDSVDLAAVIDAVARLQVVERTFTPVFVSSSLDAADVLRRHGFVHEHIRRRAEDEPLDHFRQRSADRLRQIRSWYGVGHVFAVQRLTDVESGSGFGRFVRSLDPTNLGASS